jgi:hypothetical protein
MSAVIHLLHLQIVIVDQVNLHQEIGITLIVQDLMKYVLVRLVENQHNHVLTLINLTVE